MWRCAARQGPRSSSCRAAGPDRCRSGTRPTRKGAPRTDARPSIDAGSAGEFPNRSLRRGPPPHDLVCATRTLGNYSPRVRCRRAERRGTKVLRLWPIRRSGDHRGEVLRHWSRTPETCRTGPGKDGRMRTAAASRRARLREHSGGHRRRRRHRGVRRRHRTTPGRPSTGRTRRRGARVGALRVAHVDPHGAGRAGASERRGRGVGRGGRAARPTSTRRYRSRPATTASRSRTRCRRRASGRTGRGRQRQQASVAAAADRPHARAARPHQLPDWWWCPPAPVATRRRRDDRRLAVAGRAGGAAASAAPRPSAPAARSSGCAPGPTATGAWTRSPMTTRRRQAGARSRAWCSTNGSTARTRRSRH